MFFSETMNLTEFDITIVMIISFLTSILVIIVYELIKGRKRVYINLFNTNNTFYGKGKSGYLEKVKTLTEKTRYIECSLILSVYNDSNRPFIMRNIQIVDKKGHRAKSLEEGTLNINGTGKSVAGVTTYDKLKNVVVNPYEGVDYDVNIRLSRNEYLEYKRIYLSYRGVKNRLGYLNLKIKKAKKKKNRKK